MINPKNKAFFAKNLLGTLFLIPLLVGGCGGEPEPEASGVRAVPVKLKTLETATLVDSSEYVGTLEAEGRVSLAPRINGRILKIFVKQGDRVTRGQAIIRLEPTQQKEDVRAATESINVEKARLDQTKAELKAAEANKAAAAAEVERAKADLQDLEAEVKLAQINQKRFKTLVEGGASPQQDLDDKIRDLETAVARRNAREESLNASIESLQAAQRQVERALANVDSQKSSVARSEAELGSISQNLAFNTIKSPISGIVGSFNQKKVGDYVNTGESITTITNNRVFNLNIGIPAEYRSRLKLGLPVETVKQDGSPGLRGQISYIAPLVNQNTQSILTKVSFPNNSSLRDKEYIQARVIWDKQPGVLVPTTAITRLGGQKFVFVAKQGESPEGEKTLVAEQRPIQVGSIQGQSYQIISGVKQGDKIAVTRILDLRDGTPIAEESITSEQTKTN